ncbi:flagellar hook-associated protein FlgK [Sphingomonas sp. CJ99]
MTDLLNIGASGVRAYQTALGTTSENIANTGTAGYVRRTANLTEVGGAQGIGGAGVLSLGVQRMGDMFRDNDVRVATADLSRTEVGIVWLERLDAALAGPQIAERMGQFFNAATQAAADPSASAPRIVMLEQAASIADAFAAAADTLDRLAIEADVAGKGAAADLESSAHALARVNAALGRTQPGSNGQAQLLDERDRLIDAMSVMVDLTVSTDDFGRATLRVGGSAGSLLVTGDRVASVQYDRSDTGAAQFTLSHAGVTYALPAAAGSMAGIVEGAGRIADARTELNQLAARFTDDMNAVQGQGRDLDGNPGQPLFAVDADDPAKFAVAIVNPRAIAAAGVGGGPRDNANLLALSALRTTAGYEGQATGMVARNGAALSARLTVAEAQASIKDQSVAARSEASGVDLDREAVDLIRFQQAYQASSRVIQVARDTIDAILQIR